MTDIRGYTAPGYERVAEVMSEGARVTVNDRERVTDFGEGGGAFAAYVDERMIGHAQPIG